MIAIEQHATYVIIMCGENSIVCQLDSVLSICSLLLIACNVIADASILLLQSRGPAD